MLLQNLYVLFGINIAITEVQVTFAKGTVTTPYHDRPLLLDFLLVTVWMVLFFFGPEHRVHFFQKRPEILLCLTTIHISTVRWSIPDASEPRERRFWTRLTRGFLLAQL